MGSLGVGTLLGTVSAFLIYTNTEALLGRSIQADRVQKLTEFLENDPAVRSAVVLITQRLSLTVSELIWFQLNRHDSTCLQRLNTVLFILKITVFLFFCVSNRAIHDVKATDLGLSKVRFKAEVDFDGRVVTRSYLEKQDIDQILNVSCVA